MVLETQICRRNSDTGQLLEDSETLVRRVADALAGVESHFGAGCSEVAAWSTAFQESMFANEFWPSGRILNNAGTRQGQLASCFVLPLEDDFSSLFDTIALAAHCHRTGGGTGFDFSSLRERGAYISTSEAAGASGPLAWMKLIDASTTAVMSGGKMRGANMGVLSIYHPDVLDFLACKASNAELNNFNISVSVDDAFMLAVETGDELLLRSPRDGRLTQRLRAREVWESIAESAWRSGDPGLLFLDNINRTNFLADHLGPITATNPCGEQTLYPYEASNLGSLNLASFVNQAHSAVDWPRLEEATATAVRLLDNAIEACTYPDARIARLAHANRRLGLGVMGFADLLVHLRIPYDSPQALSLAADVAGTIRDASWATSRRLAQSRGEFPNCRFSAIGHPTRNCAITSIAPTGTISMIADCSPGIEPRFAPYYTKDVIEEEGITYVDSDLLHGIEEHFGVGRTAAMRILCDDAASAELPPEAFGWYRYAHDVTWTSHVAMLSQWQRYTDNGVSKTVNLANAASRADVEEAFAAAWRGGCKGISVYRSGSKGKDLLSSKRSGSEGLARQSKELARAARSGKVLVGEDEPLIGSLRPDGD